jgi:hypothetical protein
MAGMSEKVRKQTLKSSGRRSGEISIYNIVNVCGVESKVMGSGELLRALFSWGCEAITGEQALGGECSPALPNVDSARG